MSTISEAINKRANWFFDETDGEQLDMAKTEAMLNCTIREWLNQEQIILLIKEAKKTGLRPPEMIGWAIAEWLESRR